MSSFFNVIHYAVQKIQSYYVETHYQPDVERVVHKHRYIETFGGLADQVFRALQIQLKNPSRSKFQIGEAGDVVRKRNVNHRGYA
jgi:hypothetical protein